MTSPVPAGTSIRANSLAIRLRWRERLRRKSAQASRDEITARAARLGITPERVLEEYRRIAFANLSHVVDWNAGPMRVRSPDEMGEDVAAISEIVQSAKDGTPYRVKLYDKRAALDAIARHLGMLPPDAAANEGELAPNEREDPHQRLIAELDRLAAQIDKGLADPEPEPGER
jgi:hypothetical protein